MSEQAERRGLAEPFRGVTTNSTIIPGLFGIRSTGVSTEPVRTAALAFLASLKPEQCAKTTFPVDDLEWRKWMNPHFYVRQGVSLEEMSESERQAAIELLRASLGAKGLQQSKNIMRLNHNVGELNNDCAWYSLTAVDPKAPRVQIGPLNEEKYRGQRQAHDVPVVRSRGSP